MPARIFVNYRRDDDPNGAARVRDGLTAKFGRSSVFMDVDNLLAGQRFDEELAKALAQCDVLLAVIGPRWMEALTARRETGERDYVREEIAEALRRRIVVIPVLVGRDRQMPPLPRPDDLPEDIRDLVHYQKHDVAYERFGRDIAELIEAITVVRRTNRPQLAVSGMRWGWMGAAAASVMAVGYAGAYQLGAPLPWPVPVSTPPGLAPGTSTAQKGSDPQGLTLAKAQAEREAKLVADAEARIRGEIEARQRADAEARTKADEAAAAKRKADDDARAKAAEAKRKADEVAARRVQKPGDVIRDCPACPEMVIVPSGSFTMGSPANEPERNNSERPQRTVTIARAFAVGRFEVTFAEWDACVADNSCTHNPGDQGWGRGKRPVINVSWDDAKQYVAWLSRKTGQSYRLLTEAEWEYAARAGTTTPFSTGATISAEQANFDGNYTYNGSAKGQYRQRTIDVGSFKPNAFGLYDMHGNVWEWVEDCYADSYAGAPTDGSARTTGQCVSRVLRGGSWGNVPQVLRAAQRGNNLPDFRFINWGFRLARTLIHTP